MTHRKTWFALMLIGMTLALSVGAYAAEECTEHDFQWTEKPATCDEVGYRGYVCRVCAAVEQVETIPALGHDMSQWTTVTEAACTKGGMEKSSCDRCDYVATRETDPLGHSNTASVVEPTCSKDGYTRNTCTRCGHEEKTNTVEKLGHSYTQSVYEPTCSHDGYTLNTCTRCGYEEKTDTVEKLDHTYTETVYKPTCSKEGYTLHTCTVCGHEEKTDTVPMLEHTYTVWVEDATCRQDGYTRYTCTVCGYEYKTDQVQALGHQYEAKIVAATCTADGYTRYECVNCGDSYRDAKVEKTGHQYNDGVVTKEPTQTAMGRITYTCLNCGDTYTETTPKLSNPFVDLDKKAYYYDAVLWAVGQGITTGIDRTHFCPDMVCTRGQVVTFLWRQAGEPKAEHADCPFVDVQPGAYYYDAVLWAVEQGITNGMDETHFDPSRSCTRGHVVTFLHRAKGTPAPKYSVHFSDVDPKSFYAEAVRWAYSEDITTGTSDTTFSPSNACTRAQIVTFLYRARNK